jgi:hypothetical protein
MTSTPGGSAPPPLLTVRSPADLLAAVPYLLGFHPGDSLVVVALRSKQVIFAARADLPPADAPPTHVGGLARYIAEVVAEHGGGAATIIGYGAAAPVDAVIPAVRAALAAQDQELVEALRAHDGRFWSYLCDNPECCPPEGTVYDVATSPIAAAATYAGQVVLPDRAALIRQLAPVTGPGREAMQQATRRARAALAALLDGASTVDVLGGRAVRSAGERAVTELMSVGQAGGSPTDDQVAWLTLLLTHVPVRDDAWRRIGEQEWQVDVWSQVVCRAELELAPAPASLLAFAAWRAGHGALANIAVDRALLADPDYSLARLLREAFDRGLPPSVLAGWPADAPGRDGWAGRGGRPGGRGRRRSIRR